MSGEVTVVEVMLLRSIAALIGGLYGAGSLPPGLCDTTEAAFPDHFQPEYAMLLRREVQPPSTQAATA